MTAIRLHNVSARILEGIELTVSQGELFVLLGASGAGKSTLLQVIAGLSAYQGRVFFDDECIDRLPPHKRRVGYLFQDLLLFPHCTIEKNLTLAMTHLKTSRTESRRKAMELLDIFGIPHLAGRLPSQVSGGEKQRAALARAIATEPRILLLDEPFSSLDEAAAERLRAELKKHQRHFKITTIFVTHNQYEADVLADRHGVIRDGRLETFTGPAELVRSEEVGTEASLGMLETHRFCSNTLNLRRRG